MTNLMVDDGLIVEVKNDQITVLRDRSQEADLKLVYINRKRDRDDSQNGH